MFRPQCWNNENTKNNEVAPSPASFCKRPTYVLLVCNHKISISAYSRKYKK